MCGQMLLVTEQFSDCCLASVRCSNFDAKEDGFDHFLWIGCTADSARGQNEEVIYNLWTCLPRLVGFMESIVSRVVHSA